MTLCSPRFLFRLFTPLWMVSVWISVNFWINPFMHEVNDSFICLRIYSIDAIMQSKRQNFIQTTRPTLSKLARPPSWNDHSFSGTRQWCLDKWKFFSNIMVRTSYNQDKLSWLWANQSLIFLLNAVFLVRATLIS
jgi:hypothetical protein